MKKDAKCCPDSYLDLKNFHAIHDMMPPPPDSFYVSGEVVVPTLGYVATLKEASPPGINPKILLLDLSVVAPTGPAPRAIDTLDVRYDLGQPYDGSYEQVDIRCGSNVIMSLDITIVS